MPGTQAAGKTDVTLCCLLVTLLVLGGLGVLPRGGCCERGDLGLWPWDEQAGWVGGSIPGMLGVLAPVPPTRDGQACAFPRPTEEPAHHVRGIYVALTVSTGVIPFYRWGNQGPRYTVTHLRSHGQEEAELDLAPGVVGDEALRTPYSSTGPSPQP